MNVIETDQLTKYFGSFTAVDHISFTVGEGEIFGFLGANGGWQDDSHAYVVRSFDTDLRDGKSCRFQIFIRKRNRSNGISAI